MQSDAKDVEELINHKNNTIDQLAYQQEGLQNQIADLQQTVRAYGDIFAMNRKEFDDQQVTHCRRGLQLTASERHVHELQDALSRATSSHQAETDETVAEKEDELCKLREFADHKDDIVRQQGAVIARGATIIQERDDTIERLSKELKIAIDDCRNESRERARFSKLLEERTDEIAKLKDALTENRPETPATDVANSKPAVKIRNEALSTPIAPLAFDARHDDRQQSGQWTPQTLDKYVKLPHEQRRAAVWETGPDGLDTGKFGQAGEISLRHSESLKLLGKLALVENVRGTTLPASANPSKPRFTLPLEGKEQESTFADLNTPLAVSSGGITNCTKTTGNEKEGSKPADTSQFLACKSPHALPPRLSTFHNDVEAGHSSRPKSTHQHGYCEKPRRSLQAYVEAEDSREKRGDAA